MERMKYYMLDTNTISAFLKGNTKIAKRIIELPISSLCISSITEGELRFGLAKRPTAKRLHHLVKEFLLHVDVLPWNTSVAKCYGQLRANTESGGKVLGALDMLIAAHALENNAVLVTNDKAFRYVAELTLEDWI
jgi:tRNA(fMet)-specific endonuclease VapC